MPSITDFFLSFPDESTFNEAFDALYPFIPVEPASPEPEEPATGEEGQPDVEFPPELPPELPTELPPEMPPEMPPERTPQDPNLLIDAIGTISEPTGETTTDPETGMEYPVMRPVAGWFVNARCIDRDLPDGWAQYAIPRPAQPVREFAPWVEPESAVSLDEVKTAKFAEFDVVFIRIDALKIRPTASIAEAFSKGKTPDPGDVYVLSETQAIAEENRRRRDLVAAAETVEAVQAVGVWWPGDGVG